MFDYKTIFIQEAAKILASEGLKRVVKLFNAQKIIINSNAETKLKNDEYIFFIDNYNLDVFEDDIIFNIQKNLIAADNWSKEINFTQALSSKELDKIFIDVDLYLAPLNTRIDISEQTEKISTAKFLKDFSKNKIVYGGAGAGKTTLIKKVYSDYINRHKDFDFSFPIVIRFREIDYENKIDQKYFGLFKILIDTIGINIKIPEKYINEIDYDYHNLLKNTVISFLNDCKVLLIADGFDEIPDSNLKSTIERDFQELSLHLTSSKFIITSRSNDFLLQLTNTNSYEICPLNDIQIKSLISKWLVNKSKVNELYQKIKESPYYDATMRPLTLSHLCAIYERRKSIPPKPRYIYDFIITLLLESWDQQRNIVRPSKYAEFYIEKKKEFLAHLSFWLSHHMLKSVFTSDDIKKCYNEIHKEHNLPSGQVKKIVIELENHTGIFVQSGYNSYQFSHKSLQEFLTAKYLSTMPKIPDASILKNLPNEAAILICLSSRPNLYFIQLNKNFKLYDDHFWSIFLNRLAEEKPDFSESSEVIVFFLIRIWKNKNIAFKNIFFKLLETTNLKISFKSFYNLYNNNGEYLNYSSFVFKNLNLQLSERNYFPSEIHVDNDLFNIIKKY
jgi:hypothetical protein